MDQNEKSVPSHETQKQETLADIAAEIRRAADAAHGNNDTLIVTAWLIDWADRINRAETREMVDVAARVAFEAVRLTNEKWQRKKTVAQNATVSGNAAVLRSALEDTQDLLKHFTRNGGMLANAFALHMRDNDAALAAPARNCDMFKTRDEAVRAYLEHTADGAYGATMEGIVDWLFAKAEKKGGAQ